MEVKCVYNECQKVAFRSSCHTLVLSLMQSMFWHLGLAVTKVYYSCSLPHLTCWCLLASISCGNCSSQKFFSLCNYVLRRTTGVVHIADLGYPWPHTFISPEKSVCSSIGGAIARVSGLRLFVLLLTCRKSWKGCTAGADLCFGSSFRSKDGCEYLRTHVSCLASHLCDFILHLWGTRPKSCWTWYL